MIKQVIEMKYSKSTKGTHVYVETVAENPVIPTLYIKRDKLPSEPPEIIIVTIEHS